MALLSPERKALLPDLYSQEQEKDPLVHCKLMTQDDRFTWFLTEYSHEDDDTCYGWLIKDGEGEFGYFSLQYLQDRIAEFFLEIDAPQGRIEVMIFGDRIPRVVLDEAFTPMRLSEAKRLLEKSE